jgi:hypothetical protein
MGLPYLSGSFVQLANEALPREVPSPAREAVEKALFHIERADQNLGE